MKNANYYAELAVEMELIAPDKKENLERLFLLYMEELLKVVNKSAETYHGFPFPK